MRHSRHVRSPITRIDRFRKEEHNSIANRVCSLKAGPLHKELAAVEFSAQLADHDLVASRWSASDALKDRYDDWPVRHSMRIVGVVCRPACL